MEKLNTPKQDVTEALKMENETKKGILANIGDAEAILGGDDLENQETVDLLAIKDKIIKQLKTPIYEQNSSYSINGKNVDLKKINPEITRAEVYKFFQEYSKPITSGNEIAIVPNEKFEQLKTEMDKEGISVFMDGGDIYFIEQNTDNFIFFDKASLGAGGFKAIRNESPGDHARAYVDRIKAQMKHEMLEERNMEHK